MRGVALHVFDVFVALAGCEPHVRAGHVVLQVHERLARPGTSHTATERGKLGIGRQGESAGDSPSVGPELRRDHSRR